MPSCLNNGLESLKIFLKVFCSSYQLFFHWYIFVTLISVSLFLYSLNIVRCKWSRVSERAIKSTVYIWHRLLGWVGRLENDTSPPADTPVHLRAVLDPFHPPTLSSTSTSDNCACCPIFCQCLRPDFCSKF